MEVMNNTR